MSLAKNELRKFNNRINTASGYHRELLNAVDQKTHQAALETMLAEQFVFNIVVYWEVFINDLLLSYLVMSPRQFSNNLKEKIQKSMTDRYGSSAARLVSFRYPRRLSISQASSLADPKNFNISITSASQLSERANYFLSARYARLFVLSQEDLQFIDFLIAIRNYLAHRSDGSRSVLKDSVSSLSGKNAGLRKVSILNIGTYLKEKNPAGETRSLVIAARLMEVASKLA